MNIGRLLLRRTVVSRGSLFGCLAVVCFLNGVSEHALHSIEVNGPLGAAFNTFDTSVIIWAALATALWLLSRSPHREADRNDFAVGALVALACLGPVPALSWLGLSGVALYLTCSSDRSDPMRAAATVLAALTVPVLWARLVLAGFSDFILSIDAKIISLMIGTQSSGNTVPFADGSGVMFILPACSSLTNLSFALLCGVLLVKIYDLKWSRRVIATVAMAGSATVVINILRISAIGVLPGYYDQIHGPIGSFVAEYATTLAALGIYLERLRPHA